MSIKILIILVLFSFSSFSQDSLKQKLKHEFALSYSINSKSRHFSGISDNYYTDTYESINLSYDFAIDNFKLQTDLDFLSLKYLEIMYYDNDTIFKEIFSKTFLNFSLIPSLSLVYKKINFFAGLGPVLTRRVCETSISGYITYDKYGTEIWDSYQRKINYFDYAKYRDFPSGNYGHRKDLIERWFISLYFNLGVKIPYKDKIFFLLQFDYKIIPVYTFSEKLRRNGSDPWQNDIPTVSFPSLTLGMGFGL
jgi:hypothetical protein